MKEKKERSKLIVVIAVLGLAVLIEGVFLLHLARKSGQLGAVLSRYEAASKKMGADIRNFVSKAPSPFKHRRLSPAIQMGLPRPMVAELERMQGQIDELMQKIGRNQYLPTLAPPPARQIFGLSPSVDSEETENFLIVRFDMPGMDKDKIQIRIQNGILSVEGERNVEETKEDAAKGSYFSEVQYGSYSRSLSLPPYVDVKGVKASYKKGILELKFPKLKEVSTEPTAIPVV